MRQDTRHPERSPPCSWIKEAISSLWACFSTGSEVLALSKTSEPLQLWGTASLAGHFSGFSPVQKAQASAYAPGTYVEPRGDGTALFSTDTVELRAS